jgi:hypothetical protein
MPRSFHDGRILLWILALVAFAGVGSVRAEPPEIVGVDIRPSGQGYSFAVAILHPDTGWDHYADGFYVYTTDGAMLGERVLLHPHENEQPFTRSLTINAIDPAITEVEIRAKDNLGVWSDVNPVVALPGR